ncbi:MAG: hypothetical protein GX879_03560, partial [Bacteroidales bacterium]|nr:hypothetical protein [Bacteroidales bacterium]
MKIIRGLLLIFQFALGLLLLLAYAAYYVDPLNFIWLIPLGFLLPLFLLLNVLLIPIWLLLKKKYAIISIVLILLGLPQINGLIPFKKYITPKAKCENSIKLISYNVDLFGLYKWDRNEKNKSDIFSFIEAEAPDIM